jgi:subtilisin-like proprotein convertase family protein
LQTPWGDEIRLHERNQGGSADHIQQTFDESNLQLLATLHGHSTKGDWRLLVQDLAAADVGTLNRWALEFTSAAEPQGPVVLEETPGTHIPDNNPAGIQRNLSSHAAGNVGSVEVAVNITHTYIADLRISLRSAAGTEVILHDKSGGSADNVVKTYTKGTTAALGSLAGQPISGTWRLSVTDTAGQDVGKLNSWRVMIQPAS